MITRLCKTNVCTCVQDRMVTRGICFNRIFSLEHGSCKSCRFRRRSSQIPRYNERYAFFNSLHISYIHIYLPNNQLLWHNRNQHNSMNILENISAIFSPCHSFTKSRPDKGPRNSPGILVLLFEMSLSFTCYKIAHEPAWQI